MVGTYTATTQTVDYQNTKLKVLNPSIRIKDSCIFKIMNFEFIVSCRHLHYIFGNYENTSHPRDTFDMARFPLPVRQGISYLILKGKAKIYKIDGNLVPDNRRIFCVYNFDRKRRRFADLDFASFYLHREHPYSEDTVLFEFYVRPSIWIRHGE